MKNVVPFKAPEPFERLGIDWTRDASSDRERAVREAFLTYESSCGANGLVSLVLLALVSNRQGKAAQVLQAAADFAEFMLAMQMRRHLGGALDLVNSYVTECGALWN
ncbi:MAG: hypothetical protein QOJ39_3121 [Candidatus Eremiobacteraeota bacterium]|jgi:hypothetical protein|nr:hypothetical protein [Candidatus Eremiobacteraeota bacterium]